MTYYDLPVLLGRGFKFGIADSVLWGTDNFGTEWQAVVDGEFITFGERMPSGSVTSHERMSREKFQQLFMY